MTDKSDRDGFVARWSRRKHEANAVERASAEEEARAPTEPPSNEAREAATDLPKAIEDAVPSFDLSHLPSLESITATTDIRPFLLPGVPVELARAALRRVWASDPSIRDFIGMAENQWDFTAPETIPGFGPLGSLDDVKRLVAQIIGGDGAEKDEKLSPETLTVENVEQSMTISPAPHDGGADTTKSCAKSFKTDDNAEHQNNTAEHQNNTATQYSTDAGKDKETPASRRHGSALPR